MKQINLNSLSIGSYSKEIPYLSEGIARSDGQMNYGFKNLIAYPELLEAIPELNGDRALKSLVSSLNSGDTQFFTTGCSSQKISEEDGYRVSGYIEFAWNCQVCVRDAINYFSLFFHFEQSLCRNNFEPQVKFHWSIDETIFVDLQIPGFGCTVFVKTDCYSSRNKAYQTWHQSLTMLDSFLGSIPIKSSTAIYQHTSPNY